MEVHINDFLNQAAIDILRILKQPPPSTIPSLQAGDEVYNGIFQIATLLKRDNDSTFILQELNNKFHQQVAQYLQNQIRNVLRNLISKRS